MTVIGLTAALALMPMPREVEWREGTCTFAEADAVFVRDAALPPEGYRIDVAANGVTVASSDAAGAFYAMKTLKQLGTNSVQCVTVADAPAFRWRGVLLDEGRHFFGTETVKGLLDLMADYKLNVFHWHLTDDQGWRLDIPRFPELVKYGSVRPESPAHGCTGTPRDYRGNGQPYGPFFYTAADVREILEYAKDRFITVVPEIEIPGHVRALLAAHPEFACREGLSRVPWTMHGIEEDVLCAGNDEAIRFMEQVYDEVCAIFPGTYVHIGGDECPKNRWRECPKCQARIKSLGLKDEDALQAWVTRHFTEYLAKKGRRAIGWDEVLAGEPGPETVVHSWRSQAYAAAAAEKGHDVVVSSIKSTYFSVSQGVKDDPFTYLSRNRRCPLATAYAFDPFEGMTDAAKGRVLGAECCMWSECVWNEYDLAFKLWPRACAFAEAVWTAPASPRDLTDFCRRMSIERKRLVSMGVNCAPVDVQHCHAAVPEDVPDLMTTFQGRKVSSAGQWERERVPELLEEFTKEEYGRRPVERPEDLSFKAEEPDEVMMDGRAVRKRVRVSYGGKYGKGGFAFTAFIPRQDRPAPAFLLICNRDPAENIDPSRARKSEFWPAEEIVARGYAAIAFWNGDIAPDWNTGNTRGVFAVFSEVERPYRPADGWGTLSAWAWGASRVMDWVETEPLIDARHVAVVGHSRGGKTALVAGVYDRRFAMACSNDSGCSGAKLNHIDLPDSEHVDVIVSAFPYWFCPNYTRHANAEKSWRVDQHEFVALMAPRLVCIGSASEDAWAGQEGEYYSGLLASPAWELYGKKGLVAAGFPPPDSPLQDGCISYHLRTGKHDLTSYDWKVYMDFADRHGWRGVRRP